MSTRTRAVATIEGTPSCSQGQATTPPSQPPPGYIIINFSNECGQAVPLMVDVARAPAEWEKGLMNAPALPENQGELFDFRTLNQGAEVNLGFWNEDVLFPLSVAFIGKDLSLNQILDMQSEDPTVVMPDRPFLYAVEANRGWYTANDILPASKVDLSQLFALRSRAPTR